MVNEGSVRLNKSNEQCIGLDANHVTMCKFPSRDGAYSIVKRRLKAEVEAIGTVEGEREHEDYVQKLFQSVPKMPEGDSVPI